MLALKKKQQAAAEAAAAEAATSAAADAASGAGGGAGDGEGKKISLLGGDDARKSTGGPAKKKLKPGEIRIQKDIAELDAGKIGHVQWPEASDLTNMLLDVVPDQGLWKGAKYQFSIKVPDMYPHEPPKVHCNTKIYHPNIDLEGHVCLNILRDEWKPVLDINAVIYGIIYLFYEPNANDPLNHEAAALLRDNRASFEKNVATSLRGGKVGNSTFPQLLR